MSSVNMKRIVFPAILKVFHGPQVEPLPSPSVAEFSIWTREAGAGGLSIAVEGPSKAEISFEDRKDGSCGVSYIVKEPGSRILLI